MYGCALKISEIIILLESMSIAIYSVERVEGGIRHNLLWTIVS